MQTRCTEDYRLVNCELENTGNPTSTVQRRSTGAEYDNAHEKLEIRKLEYWIGSRTDKQACMEGKVIEWTEGSGSVDRCEGGLNLDSSASRDPRTSANNKCIPTTIDNFSLQRPWSIFRAHKTAVPYVAGRADPTNVTDGEGRRECQFLFFRPACGIITRYHTSSPPHRRTSRVGRVCFLRGLINGGPRPLEYQPPGTTRTRRPRSFRGQWG